MEKISGQIHLVWIPFVIALILFLALFIPSCVNNRKEKKEKQKTEQASTHTSKNNFVEMELMQEGKVGPGIVWVTDKVNYKFRLEGNGHSFCVEFTSKDGGWTNPLVIPADAGTVSMPSDAKAGPFRITSGPEEKEPFFVQLYKKR